MSKRGWASALLSAAILCSTAGAAPDSAAEKPRPLLGDLARLSRPLAVGVPVSNSSNKVQPCRIVLTAGPSNSRVSGEARLSLAPGSRHLVPVIAPIGNYYQQVSVEAPGAPPTPTPVSCTGVSDQDTLALVLAPGGTEFAYLAGYKDLIPGGEFRVNHPPQESPLCHSWWAYLGTDLIVVYDLPKLNLSPEVQEALLDWTRLGGTLVLVSNLDTAEYRGTAFGPFLPLQPQGVDRAHGPAHLSGELIEGGKVLYRRDGQTLGAARALNEGQLILVTAPVVDQKVLGPDATQDLWREVLQLFQDGSPFSRLRFRNLPRLTHPVELPKPSAAGIAWYLVIYVLVVIPLNYWLLRRKDKMLWLIVTLPVISTVIAGLSFAVNAINHGSETVLRELGVAVLPHQSTVAVADHSLMLFSPSSLRFKIEFPRSSYVRPQELDNNGFSPREMHLVNEADSSYYRDFHVPMWSLARFRGTSLHSLNGPIDVRVEGLRLAIDNQSGVLVKNCRYYDGRRMSQSFEVGPGKNSVQMEMKKVLNPREVIETSPELPSEDMDSLTQEMQGLMASGLVGWSGDPRLTSGVKLDRGVKHMPQTLLLVPLTRPLIPVRKIAPRAKPTPATKP